MRINQNVLSIRTENTLANTSARLEKSIEKLSSGLRINRASDDAAGLAISEKLRRQVRGLSRAILNAQDGISMIQTGEGALSDSQGVLQRMRELAIQAGNDTLTSNDRLEIQKEVTQLRDDLNRISRNTEFNTKKLLDGSQTALISSSSGVVKGIVTGGTGGASGDYNVSIGLVSGGITQMSRTQVFTKNGDGGTLAEGSTQLQSISQFYDANGVFALASPQQISLQGNNKTTSFMVDGQMTLDKLAGALQNAVNTNSGLDIENSKTMVIGTALTKLAGIGGYIQMTSGMIGSDGQVGFLADQPVLSALGMATTRESKNNQYEVTIQGSSGMARQVRTETNRVIGLLDGIDVSFGSQAAQVAGTQGLEQGLLVSGAAAVTFTVSAGGQSQLVTIGAGYWTMEGLARTIATQLSTISGTSTTVVDGEIRISYTPPSKVASIGSTINMTGATAATQLGFLDGSYGGFVDGKKDITKIETVFSKFIATLASQAFRISVSDGVATAVDITMMTSVSGRTTADGVKFSSFQASVNRLLTVATSKIRLDQAGSAMAFTSTRVGRENKDDADPNDSKVTLKFSGVKTLQGTFGFDMANIIATKGSGDKNFRLHVVDNAPQYQIGADAGQVMNVAFADMSAESLGVGNLDMTNLQGASAALGKINVAIDKVSAERSKLGAFQNRLEYAINNLRNTHTNLASAESRIRDTDVATEMIEFTRDQIVSQAGNAMLAQANTVPQSVLQLLK
ncbi:MAG: flagellin [Candidatus Ozemobacteraceae bacterium]